MKRSLTGIPFLIGLYTLLYLPVLCVVVFSFNSGKSTTVWEGFSYRWYIEFLEDFQLQQALWNSLKVTSISTVLSTIIGTLSAYGIYKCNMFWRRFFSLGIQMPIFFPDIVLGISTLCFLSFISFPLGIYSLVLAHVTFCTAFVCLVVSARLSQFPANLEYAARDLGASSSQVFWRITLPLILPGVISGALLSFALSFDDFTISFFVAGVGSTTLPLRVFSMLHFGVTPVINALATLLVITSFSLVLLASRIMRGIIAK